MHIRIKLFFPLSPSHTHIHTKTTMGYSEIVSSTLPLKVKGSNDIDEKMRGAKYVFHDSASHPPTHIFTHTTHYTQTHIFTHSHSQTQTH